ncbi:MAG: AAA family ATPase [Eubacteriales bacterium]|nr:AAA family ATPase [Eubacteriales bacterium]
MSKIITKIVLTGGPAAGKTTLISRILKEFKQEDGWKVITIPESATDLISGFGIKPFGNCVSMEDFQYFVISDQLHKEQLALKATEMVPEENVLVIYDRAIFDDLAYITTEQFEKTLSYFGKSPDEVMAGYDAVLHLVTCAKGAEFAYNFGNAARYEDVSVAREKDDMTLKVWSSHPNLSIIDNSVDFEDKINRAIAKIYEILGQSVPEVSKHKYLIQMPDTSLLTSQLGATPVEMMQTYLINSSPNIERRIRQQKDGSGYLYFYTEKRIGDDGTRWVTERPISEKEYVNYLMECDAKLHPVLKQKYRFTFDERKMEIDIYPFSDEKAILFTYGKKDENCMIPDCIRIIQEVTGDPEFKNRRLAFRQKL